MVKKEINLLDLDVRLRNRQLEACLHIKSTEAHHFLNSKSCHPSHCKKGISYNYAMIITGSVLIMKNSLQRLRQMNDGERL